MDREQLEKYLHKQIPLSAAMGVRVKSATTESVILSAPLEPNVNHKSTVFGGSASALSILAAWSILHLRLLNEGLHCEVVIQSNQMEYDQLIGGLFTAASSLADASDWSLFVRTLVRRKRARIEVGSMLIFENALVARFKGKFVAFLRDAS